MEIILKIEVYTLYHHCAFIVELNAYSCQAPTSDTTVADVVKQTNTLTSEEVTSGLDEINNVRSITLGFVASPLVVSLNKIRLIK